LHVALAFPLQLWPCRNVFDSFFFDEKDKNREKLRHGLESVGLLAAAFLAAAVIPKVTIVFGAFLLFNIDSLF
jgi:hypothetical protein